MKNELDWPPEKPLKKKESERVRERESDGEKEKLDPLVLLAPSVAASLTAPSLAFRGTSSRQAGKSGSPKLSQLFFRFFFTLCDTFVKNSFSQFDFIFLLHFVCISFSLLWHVFVLFFTFATR